MEFIFRQFVRFAFFFGLILILVFLPFSKAILSIGQLIMTGAWIMERLNLEKLTSFYFRHSRFPGILYLLPYFFYLYFEGMFRGLREFSKNKPALIFASIFLLHILGLFFTIDFDYAIKDLRTKLPLLALPIFLSTSEKIGSKTFLGLMLIFMLSLVVASLISTWKVVFHEYVDIRDVSRYISHIIFSLLISLSLFSLAYFMIRKNRIKPVWRIMLFMTIIWLTGYLVLTKSMTGFIISILTLLILIPILVFRQKQTWKKMLSLLFIVAIGGGIWFYIQTAIRDYYAVKKIDFKSLATVTSRGNPYIHNPANLQTENGNYLWLYVQWDELREAWNLRSRIPFDSLDLKNQPVKFTLIRFLTSKGERKDRDAVESLSEKEIQAIEKGTANYIFMENFTIRGRIYEFLAGYDRYQSTGNPTGSTEMQRLEFWKASMELIKANWLWGVGTGDMNIVFDQQYVKMHSKLAPDQRWRSHNQYMSIFIAFGIFGFIWFLFAIFYPPLMLKRYDDFFFLVFFIIALLSMLAEDTIESQAGVTFFAFFYSFFLFARKDKCPV